MKKKLEISTQDGNNILDITEKINSLVADCGVQDGICVLFVPHTTAAISINSALDPATFKAQVGEINRLVPTRVDFHHTYDTPADAAGHIKSTLLGNSLTMLVEGGQLVLGHSQSVLFFEFDGPRTRHVILDMIASHPAGES